MLSYILRRLLLMIPTLIGVTAVVFFVMALAPGGIGGSALSDEGSMRADQRRAMRQYYERRYAIDKPLGVQYLRWLNRVSPVGFATNENGSIDLSSPRLKVPDLGESMSMRRPVVDVFIEAAPNTLLLNIITAPLIYILSILAGIYAARHRAKLFDVSSNFVMLLLYSIPENFTAVMAIGFLASAQYLHWFPSGGLHSPSADTMAFLPSFGAAGFERGWLLDLAWHLVLPVAVFTYGGFAYLTKLTRGAVLDNLNADFVRTARSKGLADRRILFTHTFRNSLIPLITVAAGFLPGLLGGSVVIEKVFGIPGLGKQSIEAIFSRDRELIMATTLVMGLFGMLCRLVSDLGYVVADPRVSYE